MNREEFRDYLEQGLRQRLDASPKFDAQTGAALPAPSADEMDGWRPAFYASAATHAERLASEAVEIVERLRGKVDKAEQHLQAAREQLAAAEADAAAKADHVEHARSLITEAHQVTAAPSSGPQTAQASGAALDATVLIEEND